jgi:ketosteroid isomerase-like protein
MPSPDTVETFVQLVEASQTVEAMQRFYADDATMRENMDAPRTGKAALIQHEEDALATIQTLKARCVRPILISGDVVVIRWVFQIEDKQGKTMRFEELAYQRWQGELMVEEQFFYDPGQFAAP